MHVFNPVFYDEYNLMNYLDFAVMKTAKLYPEDVYKRQSLRLRPGLCGQRILRLRSGLCR